MMIRKPQARYTNKSASPSRFAASSTSRWFVRALLCSALLITGGVYVCTSAICQAFPKPSPYPISWELKFEHGPFQRIVVQVPGEPAPQAFYYLAFTVTNNTPEDQQFLPVFELLTRDGEIIRSNRDMPPVVFEAIRKRERKPGFEPLQKVTGRLLVGVDQARESVAIWRESDTGTKLGKFSIFVGGLSGETVLLKDGTEISTADWTKYTTDERAKFTPLGKTLQLKYQIPGDEFYPGEDKVDELPFEWVMR